jgi:hypothetical protein
MPHSKRARTEDDIAKLKSMAEKVGKTKPLRSAGQGLRNVEYRARMAMAV